MRIREILENIKNASSTLDKKQILKDNMNDTLQMIFEDTYSDNKYHVKKYNISECGDLTLDENYESFRSMLKLLSERAVTGKVAIALVENTIGTYVLEDQWVLNCIMEKNLKVGISKDNYNSIMGNQIDKFEVALAYNLEKVNGVDVLDGTYLASRKCDGARCITFAIWNKAKKQYDITFKSRQGKEFKTLDKLKPMVAEMLIEGQKHLVEKDYNIYTYTDMVLDGEICIVDENGDEHFNWIMKEITRKNHTIENPHYKMFDVLTLNEWEGTTKSLPFSLRYGILSFYEDYANKDYISVLEQERITSQEDFDRWSQKAIDGEWEGFMLRKDEPYKSGRTKDLLKVKKFQDAEYIVEDVVLGTATYNKGGAKTYNVCSAIVINHKGNRVEVGSGLSFDQRIKWFNAPEKIIGKTVTVKYFEETTNKKNNLISLRFPVLKYVYENGRTV
jgi:DNA ligase-1